MVSGYVSDSKSSPAARRREDVELQAGFGQLLPSVTGIAPGKGREGGMPTTAFVVVVGQHRIPGSESSFRPSCLGKTSP